MEGIFRKAGWGLGEFQGSWMGRRELKEGNKEIVGWEKNQ